MTQAGESLREASQPMCLLSMKAKVRMGTWNVRTMYETGKAAQIAAEMRRYRIEVLGICESRWNGTGRCQLPTGETVIFSGHPEDNHEHTEGVAIMMSPTATKALMQWEPISSRIMTARFNSKGRKVTVIQCYAPTNVSEQEKKEAFYRQLQAIMDNVPNGDIKILMGDMNAKLGGDNTGRELTMGREALGEMNDNGELFSDFCAFNDLVIGGSVFKHKDIHKTTWISPDGNTKNQIDFISISRKWRRSLLDTRSRRGADVGSDHYLVQGTFKVKLKASRIAGDRPQCKFNTQKLKDTTTKDTFTATVRAKQETLRDITEESCVEEHWKSLKAILNETCSTVLGRKKRQDKEWLSTDTWKLIEERRMVKEKMIQCKDGQEKETLSSTYKALDKEVKKSARKDKRRFYDNLATEAEKAAGKRDLRTLYQITKSLSGKRSTQAKPIKDSQGNPITKEEKQIKQWADHFKGLLNRPSPATRPEIPTTARTQLQVDTNPPTRAEVLNAIKLLKAGKAAGPDGIPPEALKADPETTADMLTPLLQKVWKEGKVPTDWRKGYLVKLPKKGDLGLCKNWRGIMLLSTPSKILSRIILERLKDALETELRPEQAGFRKGKSCTDQIATLRIIITEQSMEWRSNLYLNFIDFEKAFDSVDLEVIWKLLEYYGVPQIFINLIQQLYDNGTCQVIHNGRLSEAFGVNTGVRQGCLHYHQ
uniref:Reverse transcriptase domain-containing protein n=1 Tax=Trichobilharzia regenti TaxID=157069 RepID=A0AA85KEA8_TRIRE|nr:unnamed protein product [Trichobilharzia regenti]